MIEAKIYFTFVFVLMGFFCASSILALSKSHKINSDKWYKVSTVIGIILGFTLILGALIYIWTN